jgi:hypothetical protein
VFRFLLWAILAALKPKALLVAENLCLRQQLLVLQRRQRRPHLKTVDRFFWVLASRWLGVAQSSPRRKAQNSVEVASAWLAPLLVVAITDDATDGPSCNSPTASGAHPTNGHGKLPLGPKANTG